VISFSMDMNPSPHSLVSFMDVRVYVFTLLMHENERSHDAVDTGSVSASWYNRNTRGNAAFNGVNAFTESIIVLALGA